MTGTPPDLRDTEDVGVVVDAVAIEEIGDPTVGVADMEVIGVVIEEVAAQEKGAEVVTEIGEADTEEVEEESVGVVVEKEEIEEAIGDVKTGESADIVEAEDFEEGVVENVVVASMELKEVRMDFERRTQTQDVLDQKST